MHFNCDTILAISRMQLNDIITENAGIQWWKILNGRQHCQQQLSNILTLLTTTVTTTSPNIDTMSHPQTGFHLQEAF